jgi:hypothetical protein
VVARWSEGVLRCRRNGLLAAPAERLAPLSVRVALSKGHDVAIGAA